MRLLPILTLCLCSLIMAACEGRKKKADLHDAPNPDHQTVTWPATKMTDGRGYSVTLKPTAGDILLNQHFSLDVTIDPKAGGAPPLQVRVDADMPAHQHGMNTQPELAEKGPRRYQADGMLFHMAGEWVITVDVTRDEQTERASFPVKVD